MTRLCGCSGERGETPGADCDRDPGHGPGLVPKAEIHRPKEDQSVRSGRGGRHDRHTGSPGPKHSHPEVCMRALRLYLEFCIDAHDIFMDVDLFSCPK